MTVRAEALYKTVGWFPYLLALSLNATIDLGHKIVVQNTLFKLYDGPDQVALTAMLNALILLPYILICVPAGYCSDRFPKQRVMRVSAWAGLVGACTVTLCYLLGWFWAAYGLTLLLGVQSAFYSPAKYGYIRELVGRDRVTGANGAVQSLTIVSILGATVLFSFGFERRYIPETVEAGQIISEMVPLGFALIACALCEVYAVSRLPDCSRPHDIEHLTLRAASPVKAIGGAIQRVTPLQFRFAVVGLATFWGVSQGMLAVFPAYAKRYLMIDSALVVQAVLACSGLGILIGSLCAARLSPGAPRLGLVPLAAAGLSIGLCLLPWLPSWQLCVANFFWVGLCGGLLIVPLNAHIQLSAAETGLGQMLASNNGVENMTMLAVLIATSLVALGGIESLTLLYGLALMMVLGGAYAAQIFCVRR